MGSNLILLSFLTGACLAACTSGLGHGTWDDAGLAGHVTTTGGSGGSTGTSEAPGSGGGGILRDTAAAGGAVGGSPPEPQDTRPARAEWKPPFTIPLGSPGWQQSTEPICDKNPGFFPWSRFDVWADERGVFALLADDCDEHNPQAMVIDGYLQCGKGATSVKFNSGSGWQLLYQFPAGTITSPKLWPSFSNGPLLLTAWFAGYGRGTAFIEKDKFTFQRSLTVPGPAFAVGPERAFLFDERRLLEYSAGTWSQVGDVGGTLNPIGLWADTGSVISTGTDQVLLGQDSGPFTPLSHVPAGKYASVWAFAPNDVWVGNRANQLLHYDGSRWQTYAVPGTTGDDGIRHLWGGAGTLYFTTASQFGRWNGSNLEILLRITGRSSPLGQFWGRSAHEVFIPVRDENYQDKACGSAFMLWFDGTQFHQF